MKKLAYSMAVCMFLLMACQSNIPEQPELTSDIRFNQVGYYPDALKEFALVDTTAERFTITDTTGQVAFEGKLSASKFWDLSKESVQLGDFSGLIKPGLYRISIPEVGISQTFEIKPDLYQTAFKDGLKSYYFQRLSMPLEEKYAGVYHRPAGHPDDTVYFHPSTGRTAGFTSSPKGWYDAGDYNKYIVNASVSVVTMLHLAALYPSSAGDGFTNIPESGNGQSDLLDELKYELDWMLTMQDTDGGVFHKLTTKRFSGFVMPHEATADRFMVGKGTTAALDFAATLAKASQVFKNSDLTLAEEYLQTAEMAWLWALAHHNIAYSNPEDVATGAYGDQDFKDEFFWAATELFAASGKATYRQAMATYYMPIRMETEESWRNYLHNLGYYALAEQGFSDSLKLDARQQIVQLGEALAEDLAQNPYHQPLENFAWGSNSDILNMAMVFCLAFEYSQEPRFLNHAIQTVDYIFGKNATGYSFLTGHGHQRAMHVHHRPSGADNIENPVPGFVVGGPNGAMQDKDDLETPYPHPDAPAKCYVDQEPSYASNEVCINWNAPLVFVLGYLEANQESLRGE